MGLIEDSIDFVASYEGWAKALIVGGLLTAIVTLVFAPRDTSGSKVGGNVELQSYGLKISFPEPGSSVDYHFPVSGSIVDIPKDHKLWLMTTNKDISKFWPQAEIIPKADGTWKSEIGNIGGEPGTKRVFGVYLIPPKGQLLIQLHDRAANHIRSMYLTDQEINVLGEMEELARMQVTVITKKPN